MILPVGSKAQSKCEFKCLMHTYIKEMPTKKSINYVICNYLGEKNTHDLGICNH